VAGAALQKLAEVTCPRGADSEAAARDAIRKMDEYVAALPRAARFGVLAAAAAVDQGARLYPPARGRRLARLGDATASQYLGLLLDSHIALVRSTAAPLRALAALCYYDVPEVRARIGYEPDPHIARVARRRMERFGEEIRRAEEPPATPLEGEPAELDCDVVVVGSGAGGATVAADLADAGARVVMVEEGGHHATESFRTDVVRAYRTLYRSGGAQTIVGTPPITFLEGRCVGGSTVVNGGMCWRTPDRVLERWSREDRIEAIGPEQMARHFEAVERRLSISPQDLESIGRDAQLLREGAEALGWELDRSRRNQLRCGGCDNCFCGCPTGAKRSMLVTNVPRALRRGALLVPDCRVDRIVSAAGRATGVRGRYTVSGRALSVRASAVVAACGAIQTPALLMRSGLRSSSGQLGRNLTIHPSATLVALFDEEVRGWEGVHQAYQVSEFLGDGMIVTAGSLPPALVAASLPAHGAALDELMRDYNRMVVAGCLVEDTCAGRVRMVPGAGPVAFYDISERDADQLALGLARSAELMFAAGARSVMLPIQGAGGPMDADTTRRFLRGKLRRDAIQVFTVHAMGTARMSGDPAHGVVSSFGEHHDVERLFVADASVLPGPVGVNPMETIVALAARSAERLI
jgi:choline dehydrogenase-like flavoprotein